jgi:hypothetical protein
MAQTTRSDLKDVPFEGLDDEIFFKGYIPQKHFGEPSQKCYMVTQQKIIPSFLQTAQTMQLE